MQRIPQATLIFDLDGTLVDSAPAILRCFAAVLEKHQLAPQRALDSRLIGPPLLPTLAALSGITDGALLESMAAHFRAEYDGAAYQATTPYDGVDTLLNQLHRAERRCFLATNKRLLPTLKILEMLNWRDYFTEVYALDSRTPHFRDKAAMLSALLEEQALDSKKAVYIGDTESDKNASEQNKLLFLPALWGYGSFASETRSLASVSELAEWCDI